jgi:hypothetical protein
MKKMKKRGDLIGGEGEKGGKISKQSNNKHKGRSTNRSREKILNRG